MGAAGVASAWTPGTAKETRPRALPYGSVRRPVLAQREAEVVEEGIVQRVCLKRARHLLGVSHSVHRYFNLPWHVADARRHELHMPAHVSQNEGYFQRRLVHESEGT